MKDIFERKAFGVILVILMLAVFVHPPFIAKAPTGGYGQGGGEVIIQRTWEWIFLSPKYSGLIMEIDFKTILAESIIAILLTIGICLIPFRKIAHFVTPKKHNNQSPCQSTGGNRKMSKMMGDQHNNYIENGNEADDKKPPVLDRLFAFESLYLNLKMVLKKKAFWLMFICVSLAILMFPPFLDEKWGKREWGFIFLPPIHQIMSANIETDEAQDTDDEFEQYRVNKKDGRITIEEIPDKGSKEVREMRKMKIDPIILTGELMIGFCLCILVMLIIHSKPNKGQN